MPRVRQRPVKPLIQDLMDQHGCNNVKDLARMLGVSYTFVENLAEPESRVPTLEAHLKAARNAGMTLDEWAERLLA